ncbi:hypothetical protein JTF06_07700 [Desemzia sp. RIT804]|uniref:DUF6320 domain-containing protein n=1 Tax=Desemzia sp. RIT 804 TaxID=2810209 RepID=UPI00194EB0AC|nr:DUF6320 domain-containing protein [Desemzia sp. RIT 804]MBM6614774.1 hypothetical protein [Desemzia sp. RIT 804]
MKYCPHCQVNVKGEWAKCPLCQQSLAATETLENVPSPYPDIPLRFSKKKAFKWLTLSSLLIIVGFFVGGFFFPSPMSVWQMSLFGIISLWLVVLIIIRKRRNIAKGIVYLIVFSSLICFYLDYLAGWNAWSTTYAIPIICSFATVAMFFAVRIVRLKVGDYILYLLTATLLGFLPTTFLFFNWTTWPFPSQLSLLLSTMMFIWIIINHGKDILSELQKRAQI